ncbi:MAG TPA: serine/threonine-protein kinase [Herpetosiphonaceae bacterium]
MLDATYRITRVIKEGGMGVVYQAVDDDGAVYAIKEMHDRFTNSQERADGIQRFLDEALLLRKLKGHPGIPHVYRSFIDEGRYYLSMEFIFGEDLEDLLKREKRFPEPQVLTWADQLCDVLEFLHGNGLIYRDMKPSNVMITPEGHVKVVDFGIAKLLQPGHRGTMIGTPGYAPPEQYQGIATAQSDVYALAATLHHLLTGRDPRDEPPFSFPPAYSVQPSISLATSQALERALQLELDDRFKTIGEFRRALPIPTGDRRPTRAFDLPPAAPPQPPARQQQAPPRTKPKPQPAAQAPPRQVPTRQQPQPKPQPKQQPKPRRRGRVGRVVGRVALAAVISSGLYFGALTYRPELVAPIQQYVTSLVEQYFPGETGGDSGATTDGGFVLQQFSTELEIEVTKGAGDDVIIQKFRKKFFEAAQQQYPGAQAGSIQPSYIGAPEEVGSGAGYRRLRATMSGFINIPQP